MASLTPGIVYSITSSLTSGIGAAMENRVRFSYASAQELVFSADSAIEITFQIVHSWTRQAFQKAHPIPRGIISYAPDQRAIEIRQGTFNGKRVTLYGMPDQEWRCIVAEQFTEEGQPLTLLNGDAAVLERYFRIMYGEIEWQ